MKIVGRVYTVRFHDEDFDMVQAALIYYRKSLDKNDRQGLKRLQLLQKKLQVIRCRRS